MNRSKRRDKVSPVPLHHYVDLRRLRYFITVASERSFTKAALSLRIAQPAISRQVQQLERELGVCLLKRSKKGVSLTQSGELVVRESEAIFGQVGEFLAKLQQAGGGTAGQLYLGYRSAFVGSVIASVLQEITSGEKPLVVRLSDLSSVEQKNQLENRRIQASVSLFGLTDLDSTLEAREVGRLGVRLVISRKHRLAGLERLSLRDLENETFYLISPNESPALYRHGERLLNSAGISKGRMEVEESLGVLLDRVALGAGVAVLPATSALESLSHLAVIPLSDTVASIPLCVNYRKGDKSDAVQALIQGLKDRNGKF